MRIREFLLVIGFIVFGSFSFSQISFKTGDASLEAELNILNDEAKADLGAFKKELAEDFGLAKEKVQHYLDIALEPAEIILSARIADITGNSVDEVVKRHESKKDEGWGKIAKDLGIKPGSPEFHALKGKQMKGISKGNANKSKGKK